MPTCFVVMGFGKKTDPISQRTFDLDKSYHNLIKPAVEDAGCECIRADEIVHSQVIDLPMYKQLLAADLVVADLSTLNANAFFELGVRYALRPKATVCIAEDGFRNPFDTNHVSTLKYRHLGEDIGVSDARQFTAELTAKIKAALANDGTDSPVYTFLTNLKAPTVDGGEIALNDTAKAAIATENSHASLIKAAMTFRSNGDFTHMRDTLKTVASLQGDHPEDYTIQQLALATYKAKDKPAVDALIEARGVLATLNPDTSIDPETLGIWAAIHKRLAETDEREDDDKRADLNVAIDALNKGYVLKKDYYNGINLAYMLDLRAKRTEGEERLADLILARRVRRQLSESLPDQIGTLPDVEEIADEKFWMIATLIEALEGSGAKADEWWAKANEIKHEQWMIDTLNGQLAKLKEIQKAAGNNT